MLQGTIKARSEMEPTVVAVIIDSWSRTRASELGTLTAPIAVN